MVLQEQFPAARTIIVVLLSMSCNLLASPLRLSLSQVGGTSQMHGAIGRCWKGDTRRWGEGQNASGEERVGKLYVDRKEMHWENGQNRRSSKFLHVQYSTCPFSSIGPLTRIYFARQPVVLRFKTHIVPFCMLPEHEKKNTT